MYEKIAFRFVGVAPLLMHSGRLADPLDPHTAAISRITSKRLKTSSDYERIAELEWRGGLWLSNGKPSIPSEAIEAALVAAAKSRRIGPKVKAGVTINESPCLQYDGDIDIAILYGNKDFVYRCGAKVNNKSIIRTRPRFNRWSVDVDIAFLPSMIDRTTMTEIACYAGEMVGIGDYRPRFGRFRVECL